MKPAQWLLILLGLALIVGAASVIHIGMGLAVGGGLALWMAYMLGGDGDVAN